MSPPWSPSGAHDMRWMCHVDLSIDEYDTCSNVMSHQICLDFPTWQRKRHMHTPGRVDLVRSLPLSINLSCPIVSTRCTILFLVDLHHAWPCWLSLFSVILYLSLPCLIITARCILRHSPSISITPDHVDSMHSLPFSVISATLNHISLVHSPSFSLYLCHLCHVGPMHSLSFVIILNKYNIIIFSSITLSYWDLKIFT